jgi:hypothetical protein
VHGDLGFSHNAAAKIQRQIQEALGQGLDQVHGIIFHVVHDRLGQVSVVNCLGQVVVVGRRIAVDPNRGIDVKVLAILAFKIKDAVVSENSKAGDFDFVDHGLTLLWFGVARKTQRLYQLDGIDTGLDIVDTNPPEFALQQQRGKNGGS